MILVREEESKKYLSSLGITDNVKVVADPAFIMRPEDCSLKLSAPLPVRYICINFSELMATYVTNRDTSKWIIICAKTIDALYEETQQPILFIPHVKRDWDFALQIMSQNVHKSCVTLIDKELNAAEMKWIISKAECNIACRTHSTIASFSTSVPTISLGYSMKSKGLNNQMYGHEKYLIYKEEIKPERILSAYKDIIKEQNLIRKQLGQKNEIIKEQAILAGKYLNELLN